MHPDFAIGQRALCSYPNLIPLPAPAVRQILESLEPFGYDRIYGAWWDRVVESDGRAAVYRSADRYIASLEGRHPPAFPLG
jgi:hypothetical protein